MSIADWEREKYRDTEKCKKTSTFLYFFLIRWHTSKAQIIKIRIISHHTLCSCSEGYGCQRMMAQQKKEMTILSSFTQTHSHIECPAAGRTGRSTPVWNNWLGLRLVSEREETKSRTLTDTTSHTPTTDKHKKQRSHTHSTQTSRFVKFSCFFTALDA